jgi:hypothetical protein
MRYVQLEFVLYAAIADAPSACAPYSGLEATLYPQWSRDRALPPSSLSAAFALPHPEPQDHEMSELRSSKKFVYSSQGVSKKGEKRTYGHSKFIGNSSGVGTNAGLQAHPCAAKRANLSGAGTQSLVAS